MPLRQSLWEHLATDWKPAMLESMATRVDLERLGPCIEKILNGQLQGRTLVDLG
jgi:hypothetical protein